jgi:hypothetical protein
MSLDDLTGPEFLELVAAQNRACSAATTSMIPEMGVSMPACYAQLGKVLNVLDAVASCRWQCDGGDHLVQYLLGRCASNAGAAHVLLLAGFYDESLSLTRSVGELANLLVLFWQNPVSFSEWRLATRGERMQQFQPRHIREALKKLNVPIGIDNKRYGALSEIGVHATPDTKPNSHSPDSRPRLGGRPQLVGAMIALNELAFAVGLAAAAGSSLVSGQRAKSELRRESVELIESIGGATILNREELIAELRDSLSQA